MTSTRRRRSVPAPALKAVAGSLCALMLLAACELRLETPPLTAPSADSTEVARQRGATDAEQLADLATAAGTGTSVSEDEGVLETLAEVTATCTDHLFELGGVYTPWPGAPEPSATRATTAPRATADSVVVELGESAKRAATDADAAESAGLGRLLASIAASRTILAELLAARLDGTELLLATTAPTAAPSGTIAPSDRVAGIQEPDLLALIAAEDALGAGWEVVAARSEGTAKDQAILVAIDHRNRAQAWAAAMQIDGASLDPRRSAYELPAGVLDPDGDAVAALTTWEVTLADRYAALVAAADPGSRSHLIAGLTATTRRIVQMGAAVGSLPGVDGASG